MIAKKNRFTSRLFSILFRKKSKKLRVSLGDFLVFPGRDEPKLSVVISKKIVKKAHQRNRLRRQIYEMLRLRVLPQAQNTNIVFLYKGGEILQNPDALAADIEALLDFLKQQS